MTPRVFDATTDRGVADAIGLFGAFVFLTGVWLGWGLGNRWTRSRA